MTGPRIVDARKNLPRHATATFSRRRESDIKGVVFHQALGEGDVVAVARYHVSKESHLAPGVGAPALCYTFFVDNDGTVYWANDYEAITWSQGGAHEPPLPGTKGNTNYVGVCFRGDFSGEGHVGKRDPTPQQLEAGRALWHFLRARFSLAGDALFGHHDFGKPACPGDVISGLIHKLKLEHAMQSTARPATVEEWQLALVTLGYDLGTSGPARNGVDGDWGAKSNAALMKFQRDHGIPVTGRQDAATAAKISVAIRAHDTLVAAPRTRKKGKS